MGPELEHRHVPVLLLCASGFNYPKQLQQDRGAEVGSGTPADMTESNLNIWPGHAERQHKHPESASLL